MREANIEISPSLFTMQSGNRSKDLWEKFSLPPNPKATKLVSQEKQYEHTDLNLGLSLGGIYGECSRERLLNRSSSISGVLTLNKINTVEIDAQPPKLFLSLARSSSVPAEAEQEQRRMVLLELAKRKVEAMPSIVKQMGAFGDFEKEKSPSPEPMPSSPSKVAAWAAASAVKSPAFRRAILKIKAHAVVCGNGKLEELECLAVDKGAASSQSLANYKDAMQRNTWGTVRTVDKSVESTLENPYKKAKVSGCWSENNAMDVMRHMPSVTTTGDGPDGRRIEGFLYKYRKGQVSIVCICHGSFLSPEEFVKHAGGKDVSNPMKQITVCSTPFSF